VLDDVAGDIWQALPESRVLESSMAMVMGPTPPGTGVILSATLM